MIRKILNEIRHSSQNGMIHIFGSGVLAQVAGLLSSVIVIRRLPKASYGYYVSANNIYSYISAFVGLGLFAAVLQFCSEKVDEDRKNSIYHFSFSAGNQFNLVLLVLIILLSAFWKWIIGDEQTSSYLSYMAAIPFVVYVNSYFQAVLRVRRENKGYALTNIVYTIASFLAHIVFTILWGTIGLVVSTYVSNILAAFVAYLLLKREGFFSQIHSENISLDKTQKKEIISFSAFCSVTNFTTSLLVLLDVTCLNIVLKDPEILSDYKVASVIPAACLFIPSCLITYYYPLMVDRYSNSPKAFKLYLIKLVKVFLVLNLLVFIFLELLSPFLIRTVYGNKYMNVTYLFRILSLNFLISSIRKLLGNAVVIIKKVKMNLIFTSVSGTLNIILNLILIQKYGSSGAAYATVIVSTFIVVLETIYLMNFLKAPGTIQVN